MHIKWNHFHFNTKKSQQSSLNYPIPNKITLHQIKIDYHFFFIYFFFVTFIFIFFFLFTRHFSVSNLLDRKFWYVNEASMLKTITNHFYYYCMHCVVYIIFFSFTHYCLPWQKWRLMMEPQHYVFKIKVQITYNLQHAHNTSNWMDLFYRTVLFLYICII